MRARQLDRHDELRSPEDRMCRYLWRWDDARPLNQARVNFIDYVYEPYAFYGLKPNAAQSKTATHCFAALPDWRV